MLKKDTRNTNQIKKWSKIIFVRATDIQGMIHCAVNLSKQATPDRTLSISELKSRVLELPFLT